MKVLILGCYSFACKGLEVFLQEDNHDIQFFTRGEEGRSKDLITGDVFSLNKNKYFDDDYDVIINFIIIKNDTVEKNLKYIGEVLRFCQSKKIKNLIQISSVNVYSNDLVNVDEKTGIDNDYKRKGNYASIKFEVDKFLENEKSNLNFKISFVRPDFILEDGTKPSVAGILMLLFLNYGLLMGDKNSTLPTIEKQLLNKAIVKICNTNLEDEVFLITSNKVNTKYAFIRTYYNYKIIPLPKHITILIAKSLVILRIFNDAKFNQVLGLFKTINYNSTSTQEKLNLNFK